MSQAKVDQYKKEKANHQFIYIKNGRVRAPDYRGILKGFKFLES